MYAHGSNCIKTGRQRRGAEPFSIQEAEVLIAAMHLDRGEVQGNCDELDSSRACGRPSSRVACGDCDLSQGKLKVSKACVMRRNKDRTKTSEDRLVELCPRAIDVLRRQMPLRARMKLAGRILSFVTTGRPYYSTIRTA